MTITAPAAIGSRAKAAWTLNAVIAWFGVLLTAFLSAAGLYDELPPEPGLYGGHADGLAGALPRLIDTLSYFTIWSNVVVAISATLLARGVENASTLRRVLRLDALLMITVTAIVYQVLLAPTAVITGWSKLTDPILHIVTPIVTVVVWAIWGPRGWINRNVFLLSLTVPVLWIGWMLARAAVIGKYPYDFLNIGEYGAGPVAQTLGMILAFGLVVAAIYWGLDRLLLRRRAS